MPSVIDVPRTEVGVIGIGNTLAGDDGAGIVAVERLQSRLGQRRGLFFHLLQNDLFEMADILDRARRFIFVDAYVSPTEGQRRIFKGASAVPMPSLHQTDIGTVMLMLESLGLTIPFPEWEIWGISITPPLCVGRELSPAVRAAVDQVVEELARSLDSLSQ